MRDYQCPPQNNRPTPQRPASSPRVQASQSQPSQSLSTQSESASPAQALAPQGSAPAPREFTPAWQSPPPHDKSAMLADVLAPLALHYPNAGYTARQLSALADDWCEDLAAYPMPVILEAVKQARRHEIFFPNIARMMGYVGQVAVRVRPPRPQPEKPASPEDARRADITVLMVRKRLNGQPEADAFFRSSNWAEKEAIARQVLGDFGGVGNPSE